ncbi:ORF55 [Ictalurid herpesvirus 1]|uniref:Uncharacterized protein ORF55 n=1 Tax=Ictalurid herpesvirus 1 (strain Auburn) TaxID=766178 RepID=VG55_ICHVA|nr:ORF55 [Ictalurid herpesvirus 1]Q00153.1 RecName: Full=Uncharacterized protein ORF55 [Ictalurid herpesvirus 1 (strain Auburn)]AAA88158.1 ORF55 [Ictalurid herpesvirus 1]
MSLTNKPSFGTLVNFYGTPQVPVEKNGYHVMELTLNIPKKLQTGGLLIVEKITVNVADVAYGARNNGFFTLGTAEAPNIYVIPPTVLLSNPVTDRALFNPQYSEDGVRLGWGSGLLGTEHELSAADLSVIKKLINGCTGKPEPVTRNIGKIEEAHLRLKTSESEAGAPVQCTRCNAMGKARAIPLGDSYVYRIPVHAADAQCKGAKGVAALVTEYDSGLCDLGRIMSLIRTFSTTAPTPIKRLVRESQKVFLEGGLCRGLGSFAIGDTSRFPIPVTFTGSKHRETIIPSELIDYIVQYYQYVDHVGDYVIDPARTQALRLTVYAHMARLGREIQCSVVTKVTFRQFPVNNHTELASWLKELSVYVKDAPVSDTVGLLSMENILALHDS